MVGVAVMGCGTVGSGVAEILLHNSGVLAKRTGIGLKLLYVLDKRDFNGQPVEKYVVRNLESILIDDNVNVVVETMGGTDPAYGYVKRILMSGRHVVTSNKELVERYGAELLEIAEKQGVS